MNIVINYWAILGAAVAMMVVGSLWYGPIFGKPWMKLAGISKEGQKNEKGLSMPAAMALMFVCALVISDVLAHLIIATGAQTEGDALMLAFWVWLGFIVPTFASLVLFERRSFKLYLINVLQYLVSFGAAGVILAHWP